MKKKLKKVTTNLKMKKAMRQAAKKAKEKAAEKVSQKRMPALQYTFRAVLQDLKTR